MDFRKEVTGAKLTDDLVVILSRVTYKDSCRSKCVNKAWSAFSSDPYYSNKLPTKVTAGLLYQGHNKPAIPLVSLSQDDGEINGILADVPHYEYLEFLDCCNGLVLCKYSSSYTAPAICRFVVCNPATRQWRILPDIHTGPGSHRVATILAFDPSWSPYFYVYNFNHSHQTRMSNLEMFSSGSSVWLVDDKWDSDISVSHRSHLFLHGMLYVATAGQQVVVFEGLEEMTDDIPSYHWIIDMPADSFYVGGFTYGCFGKSSGNLHYALPDADGRSIVVWTLDEYAYGIQTWILKCYLSITMVAMVVTVTGFGTVITRLLLSTWRKTLFSSLTTGQGSFSLTTSALGNSTRYETALSGVSTMHMYHATQSFQLMNLRCIEYRLLFCMPLGLFLCFRFRTTLYILLCQSMSPFVLC